MTIKDNKLKDLTPLDVVFFNGESPTSEKLEGMMTQIKVALEYVEAAIGDVYGEDSNFNTWLSSIGRDIGDRSELNPTIAPLYFEDNYIQQLIPGKVEHELDFNPIGDLSSLFIGSLDASVVPGQWKDTVEELLIPGDWTVGAGYIENGKHKRSRKLTTHSPSEGGSVTFTEVTSGRGSSLEESLENVIPNTAQAEDGGPFVSVSLADSASNTYLVTLPTRSKMYDTTKQIVNFSASNTIGAAGVASQYELPPVFFDVSGMDLGADGASTSSQDIPLNLIQIYDWNTKKRVEGILRLQTSPTSSVRKFQFLVQFRPDVLLDVSAGSYMVVVPGNTITQQVKSLSNALYNNTRNGIDMLRLISHKNLIDLRTTTTNHANRSTYYGPSAISNNDHSMYLHRNGFDNSDTGAGGNILRGDILIGNMELGPSDTVHEHMNLLGDSYKLLFANNADGGMIQFDKIISHTIDHAYGGLPLTWTDNALVIQGSLSDADSVTKNLVIDGDIRTKGNVVLGEATDDVIFLQGKTYVNDELTLIPRAKAGITGEEGKMLYDPNEKALLVHNGNEFTSPWKASGYTVVIGDGTNTFGKYNGTDFSVFSAALSEVAALSGGTIKVLDGSYNFLGNTLVLSDNVKVVGSGPKTLISGASTIINPTGNRCGVFDIALDTVGIGILVEGIEFSCDRLTINNAEYPVLVNVANSNSSIGSSIVLNNNTYAITGNNTSSSSIAVMASLDHFPHYSGGCLDWSRKDLIPSQFEQIGGLGVSLNSGASSGWGQRGCLELVNMGTLSTKKFLPVTGKLGIGGHVHIRTSAGAATIYVGVNCYDQDYSFITSRWFILPGVSASSSDLETCYYNGLIAGIGAGAGDLPSGTRFVKPTITLSANSGTVQVDNFDVFSLNYSRAAFWN